MEPHTACARALPFGVGLLRAGTRLTPARDSRVVRARLHASAQTRVSSTVALVRLLHCKRPGAAAGAAPST